MEYRVLIGTGKHLPSVEKHKRLIELIVISINVSVTTEACSKACWTQWKPCYAHFHCIKQSLLQLPPLRCFSFLIFLRTHFFSITWAVVFNGLSSMEQRNVLLDVFSKKYLTTIFSNSWSFLDDSYIIIFKFFMNGFSLHSRQDIFANILCQQLSGRYRLWLLKIKNKTQKTLITWIKTKSGEVTHNPEEMQKFLPFCWKKTTVQLFKKKKKLNAALHTLGITMILKVTPPTGRSYCSSKSTIQKLKMTGKTRKPDCLTFSQCNEC